MMQVDRTSEATTAQKAAPAPNYEAALVASTTPVNAPLAASPPPASPPSPATMPPQQGTPNLVPSATVLALAPDVRETVESIPRQVRDSMQKSTQQTYKSHINKWEVKAYIPHLF